LQREYTNSQVIERISLEPHELEEYAGEYCSDELGVIYRFLLRDGTLVLKLGYDPVESPLQPRVMDEFGVKDRNLQFGAQCPGLHLWVQRAFRQGGERLVCQEPAGLGAGDSPAGGMRKRPWALWQAR
jgi:hypothetical protein